MVINTVTTITTMNTMYANVTIMITIHPIVTHAHDNHDRFTTIDRAFSRHSNAIISTSTSLE